MYGVLTCVNYVLQKWKAEQARRADDRIVGPVGIEPTTHGLKETTQPLDRSRKGTAFTHDFPRGGN